MLVIRNEQLQELLLPAQQVFEAETRAHLAEFYPADAALLGDDGLLDVIRAGQAEAIDHGCVLAGDVRRYIILRMVLGSDFLADTLLPWAAAAASSGLGKPGAIAMLADEAAEYLRLTSGEDGQYALRAVLQADAMGYAGMTASGLEGAEPDVTLALLRRVWPRKYRMLPPERRTLFLNDAAARAAADGLTGDAPRRLYTVLMFLLGAGFTDDPALPWAQGALARAPLDDPDARAHALHDAAVDAVARLRPLLAETEA